MIIFNTKVYGLEESIMRSGYPMSLDINEFGCYSISQKDMNRIYKLGNSERGSGHDCALKGIIVQADFEAPQYFWMQFERYHFSDIISSQSKMHKILKMDLKIQCNQYVDDRVIDILNEYITLYNNSPENDNARRKVFHKIISNTPMGLNLTAGITTNYLELKTMYNQRKYHKMDDWSVDFITWCEQLPMFKEICLGENNVHSST